MKKIIAICLALLMLSFAFVSCGDKEKFSTEPTDHVLIRVKDYGDIIVKLDSSVAPITVANFQKLVSEGFYDGIIFHRVIKNFMIQGGDPDGNGTGGSKENIKGEFSANGVNNTLSHKRGVISMARMGENPYTGEMNYDSASSQFFIVHQDATYLDGQYAAFGYVVEGMEVVDAIAEVTTNYNDKPMTDVKMEFIKFINYSK